MENYIYYSIWFDLLSQVNKAIKKEKAGSLEPRSHPTPVTTSPRITTTLTSFFFFNGKWCFIVLYYSYWRSTHFNLHWEIQPPPPFFSWEKTVPFNSQTIRSEWTDITPWSRVSTWIRSGQSEHSTPHWPWWMTTTLTSDTRHRTLLFLLVSKPWRFSTRVGRLVGTTPVCFGLCPRPGSTAIQ